MVALNSVDCIVESCMVAELRFLRHGKSGREWTLVQEGLVEIEKCEEWSWQLKRYVRLYKPLAKLMMGLGDVEGSARVIDDDLCEAFDVQQSTMTTGDSAELALFRELKC